MNDSRLFLLPWATALVAVFFQGLLLLVWLRARRRPLGTADLRCVAARAVAARQGGKGPPMFGRNRRPATATPPPAPLVEIRTQPSEPSEPSGPLALASPLVIDDRDDHSISLVREARARYDRLRQIPRSELPEGHARDEVLRRAILGQGYDAYDSGGEWYLIVPPSEHQMCFPRTTPALREYSISGGEPLAFD